MIAQALHRTLHKEVATTIIIAIFSRDGWTAAMGREEKNSTSQETLNESIEVYQKALDDLVNVNSLFTIAVFIGLSYAAPNQHSLEARPECGFDPNLAKSLVVFEVVSFACFLLSSLVAKSLKVVLSISKKEFENRKWSSGLLHSWLKTAGWRKFSMVTSVLSSLTGIWFLTLSMVNLIQLKVGKLTCESTHAFSAVIPLFVVVLASQVIYAPSMMYGVFVPESAIDKPDDQNVGSNI